MKPPARWIFEDSFRAMTADRDHQAFLAIAIQLGFECELEVTVVNPPSTNARALNKDSGRHSVMPPTE